MNHLNTKAINCGILVSSKIHGANPSVDGAFCAVWVATYKACIRGFSFSHFQYIDLWFAVNHNIIPQLTSSTFLFFFNLTNTKKCKASTIKKYTFSWRLKFLIWKQFFFLVIWLRSTDSHKTHPTQTDRQK